MEEYDRWKEIIGLMFPRRIIMHMLVCSSYTKNNVVWIDTFFAQIRESWHFWNQLHLGSISPFYFREHAISG